MKFIDESQINCCEDVIKCIFNLNKLDLKVYKKLKQTGEIRADELAKKLKRDRSNVYRSLQKLTCSGICIKNTRNIDSGGYYHTYICSEINETKKQIDKCIDNWYEKMKKTIKELD